MTKKNELAIVAEPQAFFRELVTQSLEKQKIAVQPETEFYLVNLLRQFMTTENLFSRDEQGNMESRPLALLIKEALEESRKESKRVMLRYVGDVSLYMSGFFQDSLYRKFVDLDYYIEMGGNAYRSVAACADEDHIQTLFGELSDRFGTFVDVLAEVSDKTLPKTERDLLRIYEIWVKTGSGRAARSLVEAGILPNSTLKPNWQ